MKEKSLIIQDRFLQLVLLCFIFSCASLFFSTGKLFGGVIKIETSVAGCQIHLEGKKIGDTDASGKLILPDIPTGIYTIQASKTGYKIATESVSIDDLVHTVRFRMATTSNQDPANSNVLIDGNITGVTVFVDGRARGITGTDGRTSLYIPPGKHRIEFRLAGYRPPQIQELIVDDLIQKISFYMLPETAKPTSSKEPISSAMLFLLITFILAIIAIIGTMIYLVKSGNKKALFYNRYMVHSIIGRGGMATIYRAKDIKTNKIVALKIMDPALIRDRDLLKKFLREGESIQKLNTNFPQAPIVKVFEYGRETGTTNGRPFIAMEYLPGMDLLQHLKKRGKLTIGEVKGIIQEVLRALEAAHSQGIYHRDLSPDNIIISDGRGGNLVKLIDFGVARHEYTAVGTLDGSITGKPPYMSPEQCRGQKVDARSDIYSLGIIFYTLLTGTPPFFATNPLEVMKKHESDPVPPLPSSIPKDISRLVYRMLEKNPAKRFPNAIGAMQALQAIG